MDNEPDFIKMVKEALDTSCEVSVASTRKEGLEFLKKLYGGVPEGHVSVSKFFHAEESWTKSIVWWFCIPLKKLRDLNCKEVHLLCKLEETNDFHYLRVPSSFILKNLDDLTIILGGSQRNREIVYLHLSARHDDLFIDLRGLGKVDFSKWLKK